MTEYQLFVLNQILDSFQFAQSLRAVTISASGGATLFSDQYRAYETLPTSVKEQLADARVLHVMSGLTPDETQETQSWHPLFLRHPLVDRLALFLSTPERCQAISGTAAEKARRIVRLLYQHSIRHYRLYRHRLCLENLIAY